jgi:hypothetical protein
MSIRDEWVFPWQTWHETWKGMTYREWLIGRALDGTSSIYAPHGGDDLSLAIEGVVDTAFRIADAALKRLEGEGR